MSRYVPQEWIDALGDPDEIEARAVAKFARLAGEHGSGPVTITVLREAHERHSA